MIHQILNDGEYEFHGTIEDFKKCISSFRITNTTCDGECCGIKLLECDGYFKYHQQHHHLHISKHWGNEDILYVKYLGATN